jgi:hypothetical protein
MAKPLPVPAVRIGPIRALMLPQDGPQEKHREVNLRAPHIGCQGY